jgi:hypothetical protein
MIQGLDNENAKDASSPQADALQVKTRSSFAAGFAVGASVAGPIAALVAHRVEEETIRFILSNGLPAGAILALLVVAFFAREKDQRAQKVQDECAARDRAVRDAHAAKIEAILEKNNDKQEAQFRDQLSILPPIRNLLDEIKRALEGEVP